MRRPTGERVRRGTGVQRRARGCRGLWVAGLLVLARAASALLFSGRAGYFSLFASVGTLVCCAANVCVVRQVQTG